MRILEKELSANDVGETGGHQAGIHISKDPRVTSFFPQLDPDEVNPRITLKFADETGRTWDFNLIYYNQKTRDEYHLTGMTGYFNERQITSGCILTLIRDGEGRYYVASSPPEDEQPGGSWWVRSSYFDEPGSAHPDAEIDFGLLAESFSEALASAGISFGTRHFTTVRTFLSSLATKRFVILTGLSGSGKTQIALKFGEFAGRERSLVVPVRPDWTGAEALFGYEDALSVPKDGRKAWWVPRPLEFILSAASDPQNIYLLILDEMNLAHVERYFADFLSGVESGEAVVPNLVRTDDDWRISDSGPEFIPIPTNLFVVGTVNVDETTYMFSPKVLDRANTLEFRVRTEDLEESYTKPTACIPGDHALLAGFLEVSRQPDWHLQAPPVFLPEFNAHLKTVHTLLSEAGFEFGHRVFFEAQRFASIFAATGEENVMSALDAQVMQKVLPGIHGSRRRVDGLLAAIARFCFELEYEEGSVNGTLGFDALAENPAEAKLPVSFEKTQRMIRRLYANQFTSFTE